MVYLVTIHRLMCTVCVLRFCCAVVDILLCVHCTGDWRGALGANVPLRKGYRVKSVVD